MGPSLDGPYAGVPVAVGASGGLLLEHGPYRSTYNRFGPNQFAGSEVT